MDYDTVNAEAAEELLRAVEARAFAVLKETGFDQFASCLESDEAWNALNAARKASNGPSSKGIRASRASVCLLLVEHIRAAALDLDLDALIRHSTSLGQLDRNLLGMAERDALAMRHRSRALEAGKASRRLRRDENREEWAAEARRYTSAHPNASAWAVARHVGEVCEAKPETVRKALRAKRRMATVVTTKK